MATNKLEIVQGATLDYPIRLYTLNQTTLVETVVNITGVSIKTQIRKKEADYESYIHADMTTTNGKLVITNAANGEFKFNVAGAETRDWKFDEGWIEFEVTYLTGKIEKYQYPCKLIREYVR